MYNPNSFKNLRIIPSIFTIGKESIHEPLGLVIEHSGGFKTYIYDNLKMTAVIVSIVIIVLLIIYYFK